MRKMRMLFMALALMLALSVPAWAQEGGGAPADFAMTVSQADDQTVFTLEDGATVLVAFDDESVLDHYDLEWWISNEDAVSWNIEEGERYGDGAMTVLPLHFFAGEEAYFRLTVALSDPLGQADLGQYRETVSFWMSEEGEAPTGTAAISSDYADADNALVLYTHKSAVRLKDLFQFSDGSGGATGGGDVEFSYDHEKELLHHFGGGSKWFIAGEPGEDDILVVTARSMTAQDTAAEAYLKILPREDCPYRFEEMEGEIPGTMISQPDEEIDDPHAHASLTLRLVDGDGEASLGGADVTQLACYGMTAEPSVEDNRIVLDVYPDPGIDADRRARAGVLVAGLDGLLSPIAYWRDVNVFSTQAQVPFIKLGVAEDSEIDENGWWLSDQEEYAVTLVALDQNGEMIEGVDFADYAIRAEGNNGAVADFEAQGDKLIVKATFPVGSGFDIFIARSQEELDEGMHFCKFWFWPQVIDTGNLEGYDIAVNAWFDAPEETLGFDGALIAPVGTQGISVGVDARIDGEERRLTRSVYDAIIKSVDFDSRESDGKDVLAEEGDAFKAANPGMVNAVVTLYNDEAFAGQILYVFDPLILAPVESPIEVSVAVGEAVSVGGELGLSRLNETVLNMLLEMHEVDEHYAMPVPRLPLELAGLMETPDAEPLVGVLRYREGIEGVCARGDVFASVIIQVTEAVEAHAPLIEKVDGGVSTVTPRADDEDFKPFAVAALTEAGAGLALYDNIQVTMGGCSEMHGLELRQDGKVWVTALPADHLCLSTVCVIAKRDGYYTALTHHLVVEPSDFAGPSISAAVDEGAIPSGQSAYAPGDRVRLLASMNGNLLCRYRIGWETVDSSGDAIDWDQSNDWDWDYWEDRGDEGVLPLSLYFGEPVIAGIRLFLEDPLDWQRVASDDVNVVVSEDGQLTQATAIATEYTADNPMILYSYVNAINPAKLFTITPEGANDVLYAITQGEGETLEFRVDWVFAAEEGPGQVTATSASNPLLTATAHILVANEEEVSGGGYWFDTKNGSAVPGAMKYGERCATSAVLRWISNDGADDHAVDLTQYTIVTEYGGLEEFAAVKSGSVSGGIDIGITAPPDGSDGDEGWFIIYIEKDGFVISNCYAQINFMDDVPLERLVHVPFGSDALDRPVAGEDFIYRLRPEGGSLKAGDAWPEGLDIYTAIEYNVTLKGWTWDRENGLILLTLNYPDSGIHNWLNLRAAYGGRDMAQFWFDVYVQHPLAPGDAQLIDAEDLIYNHLPQEPGVAVSVGGDALTEGRDYVVEYRANVNATTDEMKAVAVVTGAGKYSGAVELEFEIGRKALTDQMVEKIPDQNWTGEAIHPEVHVTDGVTLVEGPDKDYAVSYPEASAVGAHQVTVEGRGNFTGTVTAPFNIVALSQDAPSGVMGVAPTVKGKPDGQLRGLTSTMEYKADGEAEYTAAAGDAVNLPAGAYLVRHRQKTGHKASPDAAVTIPEGVATLTVTFNPGYEGGPATSVGGLKWQAVVELPQLARQGYTLEGWYTEGGIKWRDQTVEEDTALNAHWTPTTDTPYTVEHHQETLAGGYELKESESRTGTTGADAQAALKSYAGFAAGTFSAAPIAPDGSTVVKVNYARNIYKLTFRADIGEGEPVTLLQTDVKFGMPIAAPAVRVQDRIFTGWDQEIPAAMPAQDATYTAATVAASIPYTVLHYRQKLEESGYDLYQTETISGAGGATIADLSKAAQKKYDGFAYAGDGEADLIATTLKLYYTRNTYTLTVGTNEHIEVTAAPAILIDLPYGKEVTVSANWKDGHDVGYDYLGFRSGNENLLASSPNARYTFKMPAGDISLTPAARAQIFTVVFDANGGTGGQSVTAEYNAVATAPTVARMGYAHSGKWYTEAACTNEASLTVTQNVTLYAHWTAKTDTPYAVEHYRQTLDGGYVLAAPATRASGTTGALTDVTPNAYEGFTAEPVDQQTIAPDGSTVVKVYYTRNAYTLTFKLYEGASDIVLGAVKFGAPIAAPVVSRPGYVPDGWDEAITTMPVGDTTYTARWTEATDTLYTIKHYRQNVTGSGRTLVLTEQFRGATGAPVTAAVKTYAGFTAPEVTPVVIGALGDTVIELTYTRNQYTLTFDAAGGTGGRVSEGVYYGAAITPPVPAKTGFVFAGFKPAVPLTMPAVNSTYTAQWTTGETAYKVEHYQETLTDGAFALAKTETLSDTAGAVVSATRQRFAGFSFDGGNPENLPSGTVEGDGSLTLKLYYTRNRYNLTFDAAGGTLSATSLVKFGQAITAPVSERTGYRFAAWTPAVPSAMPASDATYTATWTALPCAYTVEHYCEEPGGAYPTTATAKSTGSGIAGMTAQASPAAYQGFSYLPGRSSASGVITADGKLTLRLYYARNRYLVTFDANGGTGGASSQVKYGEAIPQPVVTKRGYAFAGWDKAVPGAMTSGDLTFTANWTAKTNTPYLVEHYLQNLDGTWPGAPSVSETKAGVTDAPVTREAAMKGDIEGFSRLDGTKTAASVKIAADGSAVLKLYYARDIYTLSFDTDGDGTADLVIEVKYGSLISRQISAVSKSIRDAQAWGVTVPTPIRDDALFNGWSVNGADGAGTIPATVRGDLSLKALYVDQGGMSEYVVEHYVDGVLRESDYRYGAAGTSAAYAANDYPGYSLNLPVSYNGDGTGKIKADGSLRVKLNYGKAKYPVSVNWNLATGGTIVGPSGADESFEAGKQVTVSATAPTGYALNGWESLNGNLSGSANASYTFTMPAGAVSLKVKLKAEVYAITYPAGMNAAGYPRTYTYGEAQPLPAPASSDPAKGFAGWSINGSLDLITAIPADHTGPVSLTAAFEKLITLTFDAGVGAFADASNLYLSTGLKGAAVPAIPAPARANYTFDGWDGAVPTKYPDADRAFAAKWKQGGGSGGEPAQRIPVTGAALPSASLTVKEGKSAAIRINMEPANANDYEITWTSSDDGVAAVANGVVTGLSEGTATISITIVSDGKTIALTLTVTVEADGEEEPDDPITIETIIDVLALAKGKTIALPKFKGATVSWKVKDEAYAKLLKNGRLKALVLGETELIMTVESSQAKKAVIFDGHKLKAGQRYTIDLKVRKAGELATKVQVSQKKATLDLKENRTLKLSATAAPAKRVLDKKIFWASKNPAIATVDKDGVVTAVAPGNTEIYAYSTSLKRAKVAVHVAGLVTSLKITNEGGKAIKKATLAVDGQLKLSALVNADALNPKAEWSSSKPAVASVDQDGVVTAHKKGTAVITAKAVDASGKKATLKLTVKNS